MPRTATATPNAITFSMLSKIKYQLYDSLLSVLWNISAATSPVQIDLLSIRIHSRHAMQPTEMVTLTALLVMTENIVIVQIHARPASYLRHLLCFYQS